MSIVKMAKEALRKARYGNRIKVQYFADGLGVQGRSLSFMEAPRFQGAWNDVARFNDQYWGGNTPDIRWRAHLITWAAEQALRLDGDFAEFGVNTGIFSSMIFKTTGIAETGKKFFLFDTYEGIPLEKATESEIEGSKKINSKLYIHDAYKVAKEVFDQYPNAVLVKGILPASLSQVAIDKLCFASIDLNLVTPEIEVIREIWDKLVPGAYVVLDDYGFAGHRDQHAAWNDFAQSKGRSIFTSPTGQGLLQK
jgi:O-methyltransferase